MKKEERELKEEIFTEWITFIDDRCDRWKEESNIDFADKLDYSPPSLNEIEKYVLSNFSNDSLAEPDNNQALDAIISYIGETLRSNLPNSRWSIDLEDESSFFFNLPVVVTPIGSPISPHKLITRIFMEDTGTFLFELYQLRLGFIENPETY